MKTPSPFLKLLNKMIIHNHPECFIADGRTQWRTDRREVKLMAVAENYAMVRRPRCMPYVAPLKELAEA